MQIITNQFQKELKQHGNEQFPFLVSYQKLSEYESGSFMWHWHPEIEITYVQKGTMCYKVNHMVYHLKEGDIVFNNSGALHSGTMENQKDCAYIPVTFDSRLIYGFFQSTVNSKYVDPVIQDSMLPAICIDQSEPWHKPFANIFSALLIWMKRNRIFMSWTLPSACNPCGGFFWSILPTNPRLPGKTLWNTTESRRFCPT